MKFETNVKCQIYPTPPLPAPILWIWCLIFAGPKRNSGKLKVRRFEFGIITEQNNFVIWTLIWQYELLQGENFS